MGDRRQAILLMPDVDGMHVCSFESLKPKGFYERDLKMFWIFLTSYCVFIAMNLLLRTAFATSHKFWYFVIPFLLSQETFVSPLIFLWPVNSSKVLFNFHICELSAFPLVLISSFTTVVSEEICKIFNKIFNIQYVRYSIFSKIFNLTEFSKTYFIAWHLVCHRKCCMYACVFCSFWIGCSACVCKVHLIYSFIQNYCFLIDSQSGWSIYLFWMIYLLWRVS